MHTVLVVDDNLDILSALAEALGDEGWVVVGAVSAAAAIYAAGERKVDVVLCDVLLDADTDGLALRAQFAAQGYGHIPFVFMTAALPETEGLRGESVLRKPFALSEVVGFLAAAIARHEPTRVPARPSDAARRNP